MGRNKLRRYFPLAAGGLIVAVVLVGLIWLIADFLGKKADTQKRQTLQIVKIIRPPPLEQPPPPPPPPDKVEQPWPKDTPDQKPDQTPPDQPWE